MKLIFISDNSVTSKPNSKTGFVSPISKYSYMSRNKPRKCVEFG